MARRIYRDTNAEERGQTKLRLAELLSMSYDTINRWLSRIDKDTEEERNAAVLNLYLQCYTQEEIAASVGMPRPSVQEVLTRICKYEIPSIPGMFSDDMPEDSATAKVKKEADEITTRRRLTWLSIRSLAAVRLSTSAVSGFAVVGYLIDSPLKSAFAKSEHTI